MVSEKGLLIIISGPSGSGKSTVCKKLMERNPDFCLSISATTRPPRTGEQEGINYYFRSKEEFIRMIESDDFLEHAEIFGNLYGTPKSAVNDCIDSGRHCILEIDVQGALQVMGNADEYVSIFITPSSMQELEHRLRGRNTETEDAIARRLGGAIDELKKINAYDYWVINDTIEQAVCSIESIIRAESFKTERNIHRFNNIFGGNLL